MRPGARPSRSSAGQAAFTKRRQRRLGIRRDIGRDDLQSLGQEQRRPARADDAGSDDGDAANGLVVGHDRFSFDRMSDFRVSDAGEIALRVQRSCVRPDPSSLADIERAAEIGHEHPIARDIERDADPSIRWVSTISGALRALHRSMRGSPCCRAAGRRDRSSRARDSRDRARDRSAPASGRRRLRCRCGWRQSRPSGFRCPARKMRPSSRIVRAFLRPVDLAALRDRW